LIVSGPPVIVHDQTINGNHPMSKLSSKATKVELLAAYEAALAELESYKAGNVTWEQVWLFLADRSQCVWTETKLLVQDVYKAGALSRQWISGLIDIYSQPVLRSKP
jgi:hypothetical protein